MIQKSGPNMAKDTTANRPVILVVDDEPIIADTLAHILSQKGYAASAAHDGESAIQDALVRPPNLVISDVSMPGMNGIDLGIAIRKIFPDCKVILFSGQSASQDLVAAALSVGNHFEFLQKPLQPEVLLKRVAESLKHP
jgi:CheY-like chemotaxis protein